MKQYEVVGVTLSEVDKENGGMFVGLNVCTEEGKFKEIMLDFADDVIEDILQVYLESLEMQVRFITKGV